MFGLGDVSVFLAYLLLVLAVVLCAVYGLINWNKGEASEEELAKEAAWEQEEKAIDEELGGQGETI